jgi:hypothetical protein
MWTFTGGENKGYITNGMGLFDTWNGAFTQCHKA